MRVFNNRAEQAVALGQVSDYGNPLRRHSHVDELFERPVFGDDPERSVSGTHEFDRGGDDALEHHRQIEVLDDRLVGLQQRPQPALNLQDISGASNQIVESEIKFAARFIGEGE
jgi:hypothetical protein